MPTQTSSVLYNDTVSSCSTFKVQEKTQLSRRGCMNSRREIKSQFKFLTETLQDFGTMPIFKRTFIEDLDLLEQHLTKEIISQNDYKTILTKLRTMFVNAFHSEFKERMQKYIIFYAQSFKDAMICNMNSIRKDILEIILHQQQTPHLLKQKKLMQTQEDHSNPIQALNIDSLKVVDFCKLFSLDYDSQMTDKYFVEYTGIEVKHFRYTLLQQQGNIIEFRCKRTRHQRQYDRRVNKRQMQTQESKIDTGKAVDADLVVTESSGTELEVQDDSRRSGNNTDAEDADIRPIYDQSLPPPPALVQLMLICYDIFAYRTNNIMSNWKSLMEASQKKNPGIKRPYLGTVRICTMRYTTGGSLCGKASSMVEELLCRAHPPDQFVSTLGCCVTIEMDRHDSHDVNDRVEKSIQSFVRRIFQMKKIKLFQKSSAVTTADASDKRQQQPDSTSST
ncbi:hypothetical protein Tco_1220263 [Tanacetum coccineum]